MPFVSDVRKGWQTELIMLGVDRYGFFSPASGDRMVFFPSAPLTRALSYTPASPPSGAPPSPTSVTALPLHDPTLEERKIEDRRVYKWGRMLVPRQPGGDISNWIVTSRKESKFVSRIYKGVPDRWRSAAWWILMERRASVSFQADAAVLGPKAATRDSGSLGRLYQVSTRFIGSKGMGVLTGWISATGKHRHTLFVRYPDRP